MIMARFICLGCGKRERNIFSTVSEHTFTSKLYRISGGPLTKSCLTQTITTRMFIIWLFLGALPALPDGSSETDLLCQQPSA